MQLCRRYTCEGQKEPWSVVKQGLLHCVDGQMEALIELEDVKQTEMLITLRSKIVRWKIANEACAPVLMHSLKKKKAVYYLKMLIYQPNEYQSFKIAESQLVRVAISIILALFWQCYVFWNVIAFPEQ